MVCAFNLTSTTLFSFKNTNHISSWIGKFFEASTEVPSLNRGEGLSYISQNSTINDFSIGSGTSLLEFLSFILISLYILGVVLSFSRYLYSFYRVKKIEKSADFIKMDELNKEFSNCIDLLNIKKEIPLLESSLVKTPIIMGVFSPKVILPKGFWDSFSVKEGRYIFLHELTHYKNKDLFINHITAIFQIIYWFNPLIWYALKEMKVDREIVCDITVLTSLNEDYHLEYGHTIINFASTLFKSSPFLQVADIGGGKNQIKRRIVEIASFKNENYKTKFKSIVALSLLSLLVFSLAPFLSVRASSEAYYSLKGENINDIDLSKQFNNRDGSFVLYSPTSNSYEVFNRDGSTKRLPPNSTYKIYSGLLALENGIISPNDSKQLWNGENYEYNEWNKEQDLNSALKNSTSWYFRNLDKSLGIKNIKEYLTYMGYGNCDVTGGLENFWVNSSLKISPLEQVNLLAKVYYNSFNFNVDSINAIKEAMLISSKDGISLYGKTGTSGGDNGIGWFIGFLEIEGTPYFFSTSLTGDSSSTGKNAADLTFDILKNLNILK